MKYIIRTDDDFYLGNTYRYQYQTFAALGNASEARRYKSKGIAMRVIETILNKCENISKGSVLEVEE